VFSSLTGQNHEGQWLVEGRRLAPLSERLTLHTAYSNLAQQSANVQVGTYHIAYLYLTNTPPSMYPLSMYPLSMYPSLYVPSLYVPLSLVPSH